MPTTIDENGFFKEATLRICGSLDIEKALWDCFTYIRRFMPGDVMRLLILHLETGVIRTVATATKEGGRLDNVQVYFPESLRLENQQRMRTPMAEIHNDQDSRPTERLTKEMKQ